MGDDLNEARLASAPGQGSRIGPGPTGVRCVQKDAAELPSAVNEMYSRVDVLDVTPVASGLTSNIDGFGQRESFTERNVWRGIARHAGADVPDDVPDDVSGDADSASAPMPVWAIVAVVAFIAVVLVGIAMQWQREGELLERDPDAYARVKAEQQKTVRFEVAGDVIEDVFG